MQKFFQKHKFKIISAIAALSTLILGVVGGLTFAIFAVKGATNYSLWDYTQDYKEVYIKDKIPTNVEDMVFTVNKFEKFNPSKNNPLNDTVVYITITQEGRVISQKIVGTDDKFHADKYSFCVYTTGSMEDENGQLLDYGLTLRYKQDSWY